MMLRAQSRDEKSSFKVFTKAYFKNNMEKSLVFLLIVGAILGAGIALSFYGAQLSTQNLVVKDETIIPDSTVEITMELDPEIIETGVYALLLDNFKENSIAISVYDPLGSMIISGIAEKESSEERFEIISSGTYRLEIKNIGTEEAYIVAGLGYMPEAGTLSVGITGFYLVIVGLIGIVGVGFFAVKNRRKNSPS